MINHSKTLRLVIEQSLHVVERCSTLYFRYLANLTASEEKIQSIETRIIVVMRSGCGIKHAVKVAASELRTTCVLYSVALYPLLSLPVPFSYLPTLSTLLFGFITDSKSFFLFVNVNRLAHPFDPTSQTPVSVPAFGFLNELKLTPNYTEFEVSI